MASSVDSEASKKDGALVRQATDRGQDSGSPALFTEEALLRLEAGLRAQREEGPRFSESDVASSRVGSSGALRDSLSVNAQTEPISENAPLAPGADHSEIRKEEAVPLPSWRRRKGALLLLALLLVVGAATLGVSLRRTGGSTDPAVVTNAVRSPAATPSVPPPSPAPANKQAVEAQGPATPAASGIPALLNEHPVEAQGPATPAASETPAPRPKCNIAACRRFYRSFRASDCTFQPRSGRRRICDR
jgi:hypothetical protein